MHRLIRVNHSIKGNINTHQTRLNNEFKRERIYHVHNESIQNNGLTNKIALVSEPVKGPTSILKSNSRTFRSKQQELLRPKTKRKRRKWPKMAKIPTPVNTVPKRIDAPPTLKPLIKPPANLTKEAQREVQKEAKANFVQWLKDNAGVIILNFGSIASFISFTRTDILELRLLSITGSLSSVCYFSLRTPLIIAPIIWSSIFASTNAYMVYHIYEERKGKPKQLSHEELDVYEEHLLSHAVTPRQFEKMLNIAKRRELQNGDVLVHKGQAVDKVHLVVCGSTEAYSNEYKSSANFSRRVTAASSKFGNKEKLLGGDSGAWVGELAFLDYLADRNKSKGMSIPKTVEKLQTKVSRKSNNETNDDKDVNIKKAATGKAFLSYVATEKTVVYEWDFEDLAKLMETSSELRSAVTTAMTAAGKL